MGEGNLHGFAPSCSVVICTRDRPTELDRCLEAVSRLTYPKIDVLVVDNAPRDRRAQKVATRWGARYCIELIAGANRARNRGARMCDAEILAYLDDDAIPEAEWLSFLVQEFEDPQVMVAVGRIRPLRVKTEAERLCALLAGLESGDKGRIVVDSKTPCWFELANFGGIADGTGMVFRRSVFDMWPGFDERLDRGTPMHGGGEQYAYFSLINRGYRVVYTPRAVLSHPFPETMQAFRELYLMNLSASTAQMTFLLFEEPHYRRATLKYIFEGIRGVKRAWRRRPPGPQPRIVPRWRMMLAYLYGPLLYARSCLKHAFWGKA